MWLLCWTEWKWDRFSSSTLVTSVTVIPPSLHPHIFAHRHHCTITSVDSKSARTQWSFLNKKLYRNVVHQLKSVSPFPLYRVSQEEHAKLREGVPYVKLYRYNPKHLYTKLNGYGDNGLRKVWTSCISAYCTSTAVVH